MAFDDKIMRESFPKISVESRPGFTLQQSHPLTSAAMQQKVDHIKASTIQDDFKYLKEHPEISDIVDLLVNKFLKHKPKSPMQYVGELFKRRNIRELIKARSKIDRSKDLPIKNWNLQPCMPSSWNEAPQATLGEDGEEDEEEESIHEDMSEKLTSEESAEEECVEEEEVCEIQKDMIKNFSIKESLFKDTNKYSVDYPSIESYYNPELEHTTQTQESASYTTIENRKSPTRNISDDEEKNEEQIS